jgi:hypothetical protein
MNTRFLYHAFAVREQECFSVRYEDNSIIFDIQIREGKPQIQVTNAISLKEIFLGASKLNFFLVFD